MDTAKFLEAYPRELSAGQIHHGAKVPGVREAQLYSYNWGLVAHAALTGDQNLAPGISQAIAEYEDSTGFHSLEEQLLGTDQWPKYRNEINFASLNEHMADLWTPILHGEWPKGTDRVRAFNIAMNSLALEGLLYYTLREQFVRANGTEIMYDEVNEPFTRTATGIMQEYDAGIVLADFARKHPNLTVVPAPMQFEHNSPRTKRASGNRL